MGLRIRTNVVSINAQRAMQGANNIVEEQTRKLSSGKRINRGADDAAGLAISEGLHARVRSILMDFRNAQDGISMVEVGEGGLNEISNCLVKLRELSIQAASDTIGARERKYLHTEYVAIKNEIDRIAASTEYDGLRLLVGDAEVSNRTFRAFANREHEPPLEVQVGPDYFPGVDGKANPNPVNIIKIDVTNMVAFTHGEDSLNLGQGQRGTRIDSKGAAQNSMGNIDYAMQRVAEYRAFLGAMQNRLQYTMKNLSISAEQLSSARSRIVDADYAGETADFVKGLILRSGVTSIVATANVQPKIALALLDDQPKF